MEIVDSAVLLLGTDVSDEGCSLDGRKTRTKLQDEVRRVIRTNQIDPDGTGTYNFITMTDLGKRAHSKRTGTAKTASFS